MTSTRPVMVALGTLALAACAGESPPDVGPSDAAVDAPPDPFAHRFDGPEDFPRTGCRAGSLAGFAETGTYPTLGLRFALDGGRLRSWRATFLGEEEIAYQLTADDLIIREEDFSPTFGWSLLVTHLCDVVAPGVVRGHRAFCTGDVCYEPADLEAERFHRLAGEGDGDGLALLGELALPPERAEDVPLNVRVIGDVAHVAMGTGGLRMISIANPRAPAPLGHYQPAEGNFFNDVKLVVVGGRRYALLAGSPSQVVDVSSPASPQLVATLPVSAHTLFVDGHHAYLVDGSRPTLWIYDVADPRAPVRRAQWQVPGLPAGGFHDLYVADGVAYLSTIDYGITIADVTDPVVPRLLGASPADPEHRYWHSPWATTIGGRKLVLNGDEGPSPRLAILDADPASPTFLATVGTWGIPGPISLHNVMAIGDRAYVAHYQHGIRVLDLADPSAPRPIGYFNTWRDQDATAAGLAHAIGHDLDPARRRIYVADTQRGLLVLQATAALMP